MSASNQRKNQHLLWRAAFGPMTENAAQLEHVSQKELYLLLKKKSSKQPDMLNVARNTFDGLVMGLQDIGKMQKLSAEQRKQLRKQSVDDIKSLNLSWLSEMINSESQLREKMSLFWHGHFACRIVNIYYQQQLLDVIRRNALGNFGDLLREVSKSPAMLSFLNNQQNRKQHPNENFAREVMELFTMGRGNYTETDVKEGARAFTGWGFNLKGEFVDRPAFHDSGTKTFLGKTGNFDGDDIIDIILEQKATATFIVRKIYRYFVNEDIDENIVSALAEKFYQSHYDIGKLLDEIYLSHWFYDEKNIGIRIKSPVELLVGIRRMIPMELARPEMQLLFQRVLGQLLFYPPNVAGWPGGQSWIDSTSLMWRLRLPQILASAQEFLVHPKDDDDVQMGMEEIDKKAAPLVLTAEVSWEAVTGVYKNIPREALSAKISDSLLQTRSTVNPQVLKRYADDSSRENFIKTTLIEIMSTPEYQMC